VTPSRRSIAALIIAAVAVLMPACSRSQPPSMVLIIVDTLRADHMGTYGYDRETSPNLDALAQEAALFENAFAAATWTLPSVASMFTGLIPSQHDAGRPYEDERGEQFSIIRPQARVFAEVLREHDYTTAAIVNAPFMHEGFGFARGFDHYDWAPASDSQVRRADVTVDTALAWLDQHGNEPFFLVVHVFDVHRHYDAPEPFRGRFTDEFGDPYRDTLATLESRDLAENNLDHPFIMAAYDEEIAFVDAQMGRFFEGMRARGILDASTVMLTSDHGEGFEEHDSSGHGHTLFNEMLRVPLMVWGPDVEAGRYEDPVSLIDLEPTILEVSQSGVETMGNGSSLWPLLTTGRSLPRRTLFAEWTHPGELKAVIRWPFKAILDPETDKRWLFNLSEDPGEEINLLEDRAAAFYEFQADLQTLLRPGPGADTENQAEIDPAVLKALRSLGYIR